MSDRSETAIEQLKPALQEIAEAVPEVTRRVYREHGAVEAVAFVLISPILVPVAAIFYFSIPREKRELLDESEDFTT